MLRSIALSIGVASALTGMLVDASSSASVRQTPSAVLDFIDTSFENASPLWYEIVDDVVRIHLLYDHERSSPNRAAGHIHFVLHARPGAKLTLEFRNLDNVWNGQPGSVAGELKTVAISDDGKTWRTVPTDSLPGNRVQLRVDDARAEAATSRASSPIACRTSTGCSTSIRAHRLVRDRTDRQDRRRPALEIVRIGDPAAPYRVFVRARAHPWEAGSNWVAQGLIERLLTDDEEARRSCASTASTCCRWRTRTASRAAARGSTCAGRI